MEKEHTMHNAPIPVYDLSMNVRVFWQAHSMSNAGNNGSNRLMPRRQLLADGTETDACSGNIAKHHHAVLTAEYFEAAGLPLCPACKVRDGRRAAALVTHPDYSSLSLEQILTTCALCDAHGFLLTSKNTQGDNEMEARQRLSKDSLLQFSYALALPEQQYMTQQIHTRNGSSKEEGQMIMKMPARSGAYALHVRYQCVGVGADTEQWKLHVTDQEQRRRRHQAILHTLRDTLLSPEGALTATMLPHLTGMTGIIVTTTLGRAPIYSALQEDFVNRLQQLQSERIHVYPFTDINEFHAHMQHLIEHSVPATPHVWFKMLEEVHQQHPQEKEARQ